MSVMANVEPMTLRVISAREFAGRFAHGVRDHQQSFAWFLGAGCSKSSGIQDASGLVEKWLAELHELRAGAGESFESWITIKSPSYDPRNPALHYATAFESRHPFPADRQREIEMICATGEPAYGYATLAQLLSHKEFGRFCNTVLTTNFDNLIADALYLYGERHARPLVITHEALARYVSTSSPRPIVVKLHGDAHLDPKNLQPETREIDQSVSEPLYPFLQNHALIFVGYGGNDESILRLVRNCPIRGIAPPIYWVSKQSPPAPFAQWLHERGALRVDHTDFDQLMHLIRGALEIELLDKKRWDRIGDAYYRDFVRLKEEIEVSTTVSEDSEALRSATEAAQKSLPNEWTFYSQAKEHEKSNPDQAEELYRLGLKQYPHSVALNCMYGAFLARVRKQSDAAKNHFQQALNADENAAFVLASYAWFLHFYHGPKDNAEVYYKRALDINPSDAVTLGNYAIFLHDIRKDVEGADIFFRRALDAAPDNAVNVGNYGHFLSVTGKDEESAEIYLKRSLDLDPNNASNLRSYARFLRDIRKDVDAAEAYYKRAIEIDPRDAESLGSYAIFLARARGDMIAAELYYKRALDSDPNHPNFIGNYA
jgi:tetratricopeptide (TPR) repeat protein